MLEARGIGTVNEGKPVGKFIVLESRTTRLLKCNGLAVSNYVISIRGSKCIELIN